MECSSKGYTPFLLLCLSMWIDNIEIASPNLEHLWNVPYLTAMCPLLVLNEMLKVVLFRLP